MPPSSPREEPLEAVFLDVGETLVREEPLRWTIYAEAARRRGVEIEDRAMLELMVRINAELPAVVDGGFRYTDPWFEAYIRRIFRDELGLPGAELGAVTQELFARFEDPATFHLYPGARDLLATCRAHGLVLGVISNWSARLPRVLAGLGLDGAFDFVLCSALEAMEKPDPAIFRAALERAGVPAQRALHAGDHPEKDGYASRLGIEAVLVDHRGRLEGRPPDGLTRVGGLPELQDHILSRLPGPTR